MKIINKIYVKVENDFIYVGDEKDFSDNLLTKPLIHPIYGYNQTIIAVGEFMKEFSDRTCGYNVWFTSNPEIICLDKENVFKKFLKQILK